MLLPVHPRRSAAAHSQAHATNATQHTQHTLLTHWPLGCPAGTSAGQEASGPSLQPVTTCRPSLDDDPSLAKAVADSEAGLDAPLAMEACAVHAVDLSETGLLAAGADSLVRVYSYEG